MRSVFGRIRHDFGVHKPVRFQGAANLANASVHHVGWGNHIRACPRIAQRLLHQYFSGFIVQYIACLVNQTILTVRGIGIQRAIGDDAQLRKFFFERAHHARNQAVGVECFASIQGFFMRLHHGEQSQSGNIQSHSPLRHAQQLIQRQAKLIGHAGNRCAQTLSFGDKHRVN